MKRQAAYKIIRDLLPGYDVVAAMTQRALAVLLVGRKPEKRLRGLSEHFELRRHRKDRRFDRLEEALEAYIRLGRDLRMEVPIDYWWARPFEVSVYKALRKTVAGETVSYGEIARRVQAPRRARQVGRALSRNQILIAVPCHRVVRSDHSLGGFTGGLDLKARLLRIENPVPDPMLAEL